jgi:hypothetical protein
MLLERRRAVNVSILYITAIKLRKKTPSPAGVKEVGLL